MSSTSVSPARAAAFDILLRVASSAAHSDDLLHGPRLAPLSQADRDLTTALVLGVLRWLVALDAHIRPLLNRPDSELPEPVSMALRLGAFQLLYMDRIPAHAALNESVELTRTAGHPHAAGMVNAILRKLTVASPARKPLVESTAAMAERLGHPRWLVQRWVERYGRAAAEAVCAFDQQEPGCADVFPVTAADMPLPIMDPGSRLVAEMTAVARAGAQNVWDCCAAPGGKTLVLAARLPEASLLATDQSPKRAERLKQRLAAHPMGGKVLVLEADAAGLPATGKKFDLILCDVPCSGTGTLARNPEVRHRLLPEDLVRHADRQRSILSSAIARLEPGGVVVYSTCSLETEECENVVTDVLKAHEGACALVPASTLLDRLLETGRLQPQDTARWVDREFLRTLPGFGFQGDGFFAAVIQKH